MIDLIYAFFAVPVCAALASISVCRLNYLDPHDSKIAWVLRYFALGFVAAGVGLEALLHPQIFPSDIIKFACRAFGFMACSAALWAVLSTRERWIKRYTNATLDQAPSESNRAPLGVD